MRLCIIPARGGSKRIPGKNTRIFCGKPIIAWSIEAARTSGCFDHIIVSTDDDEIAQVAREWGAETPFIRPASLCDDYVGTLPIISHAIRWCQDNRIEPEFVCCLYATAPFVRADDLRRGLTELTKQKSDYVFSVTSFPFPIQRALKVENSGRLNMFMPEHENTRSQDLEDAWHDAGQFYWANKKTWLEETPVYTSFSRPLILPRYRVQDIDTPEDWRRAELMFQVLQQDSNEERFE